MIHQTGQPEKLTYKPDFADCMARIYAWYEQKMLDRPPVRFYHHNVEYEQAPTADSGPWQTYEERWLDVEYQINSQEQELRNTI